MSAMVSAEELAGLLPHSTLHVASTRPEVDTWTDLTREFLAGEGIV
jgi:hypothetical protein